MNNIRITMLGAPAAGKTCLLLGMYAVMRQGVSGFTFTAKDMDTDLDLSEKWDQIVDPQQGLPRWPPSTNVTDTFSFNYCYGFKPFMGFDWIDYRGGVLKEYSNASNTGNPEPSISERQKLIDYFKQSDCVFVCISGEWLSESIEGRQMAVRTKAAVDRMNQFISIYLPTNVRPSIAIVITKCDYMQGRNTEEVIEEIKRLFNPFFAPETGWDVMICPVTLGLKLHKDNNDVVGDIAPWNIQLPVTYAAYQAFKRQQNSIESMQRDREGRKRELGKNWFRKLVNRSDISSLDRALAGDSERILEIETNMRRLVDNLMQRASTYYNGEDIYLEA